VLSPWPPLEAIKFVRTLYEEIMADFACASQESKTL